MRTSLIFFACDWDVCLVGFFDLVACDLVLLRRCALSDLSFELAVCLLWWCFSHCLQSHDICVYVSDLVKSVDCVADLKKKKKKGNVISYGCIHIL